MSESSSTRQRRHGSWENPAKKSLKELTTAPPMSEKAHKAISDRRVASRRSIEDRLMEKESLK